MSARVQITLFWFFLFFHSCLSSDRIVVFGFFWDANACAYVWVRYLFRDKKQSREEKEKTEEKA